VPKARRSRPQGPACETRRLGYDCHGVRAAQALLTHGGLRPPKQVSKKVKAQNKQAKRKQGPRSARPSIAKAVTQARESIRASLGSLASFFARDRARDSFAPIVRAHQCARSPVLTIAPPRDCPITSSFPATAPARRDMSSDHSRP